MNSMLKRIVIILRSATYIEEAKSAFLKIEQTSSGSQMMLTCVMVVPCRRRHKLPPAHFGHRDAGQATKRVGAVSGN